jgi:hypothetical protein
VPPVLRRHGTPLRSFDGLAERRGLQLYRCAPRRFFAFIFREKTAREKFSQKSF